MLEIWQADAQGRFSDPQDARALPNTTFKGFGRCGTDGQGGYFFDTIKPGPVPDPDGKPQAPHLVLAVFARGMLLHLYTRIYFDGEAANANDPVLALVPADRRATLIAKRKAGAGNRGLHARHPSAGRQRDGVFRRLRFSKVFPSSCPGLSRASVFLAQQREDVDGRVRPGHDVESARSPLLHHRRMIRRPADCVRSVALVEPIMIASGIEARMNDHHQLVVVRERDDLRLQGDHLVRHGATGVGVQVDHAGARQASAARD